MRDIKLRLFIIWCLITNNYSRLNSGNWVLWRKEEDPYVSIKFDRENFYKS